MPLSQQREMGDVFMRMLVTFPLVEPDGQHARPDRLRQLASSIATRLERGIGLHRSNHRYVEWLGLECSDVRSAVWMMRALVASNVLSRREDRTLFVPVNPSTDPDGALVAAAVARVHTFASARGVHP